MVMHGLSEPPKIEDWIGVEDALNPIEERRRIRHKASIYMLEVEDAAEAEESQKEEGRSQLPSFEDEGEDVWARKQRVQRLVEEDMVEAMSDDDEVAGIFFGLHSCGEGIDRSRKGRGGASDTHCVTSGGASIH